MTIEIERRYIPKTDAEIRVSEGADKRVRISGYFAKFGVFSKNLGGFKEIIERGFFSDALVSSDTVDLFNHDPNYILGRKSAGTLRVWEDEIGLAYECFPPDSQTIRDLVLTPIERGDIKGNSFGFRVKSGGDSWGEDEDGLAVRTLNPGGCSVLIDGSQVVNPAYDGTEVALRSMDAWKEKRNNPDENISTNIEESDSQPMLNIALLRQRRIHILKNKIMRV